MSQYTHDIKENNKDYSSITCRCGEHFDSLEEYGKHLVALAAEAEPSLLFQPLFDAITEVESDRS